MKDIFGSVFRRLGIPLTVHTRDNTAAGTGILLPVRSRKSSDGGISHKGTFRFEPQKYMLYTSRSFLENTVRGDTVSDGENEYYILWKDIYKSRWGDYCAACVKKR